MISSRVLVNTQQNNRKKGLTVEWVDRLRERVD